MTAKAWTFSTCLSLCFFGYLGKGARLSVVPVLQLASCDASLFVFSFCRATVNCCFQGKINIYATPLNCSMPWRPATSALFQSFPYGASF